jgi:UDPglucose 6-dehydrogenase
MITTQQTVAHGRHAVNLVEAKSAVMNISVIGLGKLGLCTAACLASKGHHVIGVDSNMQLMGRLQAGECPIQETGLPELLQKARGNFEVSMDVTEAVRRSDVTMIIVPTPSGPDGKFSNEYLKVALKVIGAALKSQSRFHVVDVVSTVMPGSCDNEFRPLLEKLSGRVCGRDFGLVYNPEFIALGSVVRDFMRPDMVLIGASDDRSGRMVEQIYLNCCESSPYIATMSLFNAELSKLSLNCFVTTKISFANELAALCENLPGADVDVITNAIGCDSRIGSKYLRGGLGFAGTCFPRDNVAFGVFAKEVGHKARLSSATVAINDSVVERLLGVITSKVPAGEKVALLGMSFKPHTHIVEKSQSIMLAQRLIEAGYAVSVHDPSAMDETAAVLGKSVEYCPNPRECAAEAAAVVLLTSWPEYRTLDWDEIEKSAAPDAILLDSWRELKDRQWTKFEYIGLGLGGERRDD